MESLIFKTNTRFKSTVRNWRSSSSYSTPLSPTHPVPLSFSSM